MKLWLALLFGCLTAPAWGLNYLNLSAGLTNTEDQGFLGAITLKGGDKSIFVGLTYTHHIEFDPLVTPNNGLSDIGLLVEHNTGGYPWSINSGLTIGYSWVTMRGKLLETPFGDQVLTKYEPLQLQSISMALNSGVMYRYKSWHAGAQIHYMYNRYMPVLWTGIMLGVSF